MTGKEGILMKNKKTCPIFTGKIENFGYEILFKNRYKEILQKRIGGKHGIYALYDKAGNLYYIGQTNKMISRIKYHKKDHHAKKWETFSVFLTRSKQYPVYFEDAVISIVGPTKGNRQKPLKIKSMNSQIEKDMEETDRKNRKRMTRKKSSKGSTKKKRRIKAFKKKRAGKNHSDNPFKKRVTLRATYKGKKYTADWLQSGKAKYPKRNGKTYPSHHAVAQMIVDKVCGQPTGVTGTHFWTVQKKRNKWVKLCNL